MLYGAFAFIYGEFCALGAMYRGQAMARQQCFYQEYSPRPQLSDGINSLPELQRQRLLFADAEACSISTALIQAHGCTLQQNGLRDGQRAHEVPESSQS